MTRPFLLDPLNVTSPARTPWGGTRIARVLKAGLVPPDQVIGESWELSCGAELPSRLEEDARTLAEVLSAAPGMLGREAERGATALLVKLLDAREALSVQIHPRDDDPALGPDESGKPESWYVEHAEPGAGIWIGLAEHATRESVARAIASGDDLSRQLAFVEVAAGDFFLVESGTPHAIGPGVTVVEPQRVLPGRRGVTYRYWDWNRRYDVHGLPSPDGAARALHVERALAVTDWERPRGAAFLRSVRLRSGQPGDFGFAPYAEMLAGARGAGSVGRALGSDSLEVWRLSGSGAAALEAHDSLRSITVLDGEIDLGGVAIPRGRTAVIPAGERIAYRADRVHAILAAAR